MPKPVFEEYYEPLYFILRVERDGVVTDHFRGDWDEIEKRCGNTEWEGGWGDKWGYQCWTARKGELSLTITAGVKKRKIERYDDKDEYCTREIRPAVWAYVADYLGVDVPPERLIALLEMDSFRRAIAIAGMKPEQKKKLEKLQIKPRDD